MGLFDSIKGYFNSFEEEDTDAEALEQTEEKAEPKKAVYHEEQPRRQESAPRIIGGKSKTVNFNQSQMQVVLVKPERYEEVREIADHLNAKKTVVLNLEAADRDLARRVVDFLSGAAYANGGNMRKISKGTFLIVPNGVDMMGELLLDELEEGRMYL